MASESARQSQTIQENALSSSAKDSSDLRTLNHKLFQITRRRKTLQDELATLNQEEVDLEIHRARLVNSSRSIHRLPDEVLSVIILYAITLPSLGDSTTWSWNSNVCHRWRQCALRSPKIWSHLMISPTSRYDAVSECLKRSRSAGLYLSLSLRPCRRSTASQFVHFVNTTLAPHFARCRGLEISIYDASLIRHFFPLPPNLYTIHEFTIRWHGPQGGVPIVLNPTDVATHHLPALKRLTISAHDVEEGLFPLQRIQCANITHLRLWKGVPCQLVWNALSEFTSLRAFHWEYSGGAALTPPSPPSSPVIIPQLESIQLLSNDWQAFFTLARTPALKNLAATGGIQLMPDQRSTRLGVAVESGNLDHLEVFDLEMCRTDYETICGMFRRLRLLRHFSYNWWSNETCLALEILAYPDSETTPLTLYCPRLSTLQMLVKDDPNRSSMLKNTPGLIPLATSLNILLAERRALSGEAKLEVQLNLNLDELVYPLNHSNEFVQVRYNHEWKELDFEQYMG